MQYDVFISHASEDKREVAAPLARSLRQEGLAVWYDETQMELGGSIREQLEDGLANSRFVVLILSRAYFSGGWTKLELDTVLSREARNKTIFIPVWHDVSEAEVADFSPFVASKSAISTSRQSEVVARRIAQQVNNSPMVETLQEHLRRMTERVEAVEAELQQRTRFGWRAATAAILLASIVFCACLYGLLSGFGMATSDRKYYFGDVSAGDGWKEVPKSGCVVPIVISPAEQDEIIAITKEVTGDLREDEKFKHIDIVYESQTGHAMLSIIPNPTEEKGNVRVRVRVLYWSWRNIVRAVTR